MDASSRIGRRTLLAVGGALPLAACVGGGGPATPDAGESGPASSDAGPGGSDPTGSGRGRLSYGDDPSQWAQRQVPEGPSRGTVVVIHGGFWRARYGADLGEPLAQDLTARGWTTLNVEYRRVGNGGGFPQTFDDVHAALELVQGPGPVVTLGHSAGGHLAAWAAGRLRTGEWSGQVEVTHVISQAGVLDLTAAYRAGLGSGAVHDLLGAGPEDPRYDLVDPRRQVPLEVPLWAVHAPDDGQVPISQSVDYVAAATAAGGDAELAEVTGGHFDLIDVDSAAWARIVQILDGISPV